MTGMCGIEDLFNGVKTSHREVAKASMEKARREVAILDKIKCINDLGKTSIRTIKEIIEHVSKEEWKHAKDKYPKAERGFNSHVKGHLKLKLKEIGDVADLPEGDPLQIGESNRDLKNGVEKGKTKGQPSYDNVNSRSNDQSPQTTGHIDNSNEARSNQPLPHTSQQLNDSDKLCASQHSHQTPQQPHGSESSHSSQHANQEPRQLNDRAVFQSSQTKQYDGKASSLSSQQSLQTCDQNIDMQMRGPGDVSYFGQKRPSEHKNSSKTVSSQSEDLWKTQESKRSSEAMRRNNPDIADLSDTNRPTKIAERFSELYDNEWTEAFEEISRKNKSEKETIKHLLSIVKAAYEFCTKKAENDLKLIVEVFDSILTFGPQDYKKQTHELQSRNSIRSDERKDPIVQYRKEMADIALPRLKNEFTNGKLRKVNTECKLPARLAAVEQYSKKAVELTWWMCVQDPSVFLCPTNENGKQQIDNGLYRAYTKTGTKADFFVWPALRLYKEGGVLMKGVVQYL